MDTAIAMLFAGIAAWAIGYGPIDILGAQVSILVLGFAGRRVIDWQIKLKNSD